MKEFRLMRIDLYNIFNYRGKHTIDFTPRKDGNIFLFDIKNGGGKTSLFLSIKWGFYGDSIRYIKDGKVLKHEDFMNQDERSEGRFYVKVCFEYDGKYMELYRDCKDFRAGISELHVKVDGMMLHDEKAKDLISQIVPSDYGDFFMFNGEVLQDIANSQNDDLKRQSVMRMLGLKQLEDLRDILRSIKGGYDTEFQRIVSSGKKEQGVLVEIQRLEDKKSEYSKLRDTIDYDLSQIRSRIYVLEEERRNCANLEKNVDELSKVTQEVQKLKSKIDSNRAYLSTSSQYVYMLFLNKDVRALIGKYELKRASLQADNRRATGGSTDYLSEQEHMVLNHIRKCPLCLSELSDEELGAINQYLLGIEGVKDECKARSREIDELRDLIQTLRDSLSNLPNNLKERCTDLFDDSERLISLNQKHDELNAICTQSDIDRVREISNELTVLYKKRTDLESDLFTKKKVLEQTEFKLGKEKKKYRDSVNSTGQTQIISDRIDHTRLLIDRLDHIIKEVSRSKRESILKRADEVFMGITNKSDVYRGLEYDNSKGYSMHIVKKDGQVVPNPSSGENHVLAISFLISLSLNTERLTPLVMDTPLSRLDVVHKTNIGKALSKLDNQVLFLAQPGELDSETRDSMMPSLAKMFEAEPTDDNSACIVEVDF